MANNTNLEERNPIGKWTASVKTGRKLILVVHGVIPTSGEKLPFYLKMADSQDINPLVLVMELSPDVEHLDSSGEANVYYSEVIDRYDQYESILVRGNGRDLAFFDIEKAK